MRVGRRAAAGSVGRVKPGMATGNDPDRVLDDYFVRLHSLHRRSRIRRVRGLDPYSRGGEALTCLSRTEDPDVARRIKKARTARAGRIELMLRLADPRQLFVADPHFFEAATLTPGIEHLYEELRWRELKQARAHDAPAAARRDRARVAGESWRRDPEFCTARRHRVENELRALVRDGLRALALGLVLLAIALAVSVAIRRSSAPESIRIFFGDGVFLVAAWVGMWYPLDTLVYTPRPLRREREVLDAMLRMELVIEPSED